MENNKKNMYYLVLGVMVLLILVGGITFAYFLNDVTVDNKNIAVITDDTASFSANISKDLSINVSKDNMIKDVAWNYADTAEITVHLDATVGYVCLYDVILENEGDTYESDVNNKGGGLTLWMEPSDGFDADSNAKGAVIKYLAETDYGSLDKVLAKGRIATVDSITSEYKINVNLKWTNLDTDQLANSGKSFRGKLKVENVKCALATTIGELAAANTIQVGDFVTYDAGVWTEKEIASIKTGTKGSEASANNDITLPTTSYQFGGFTADMSRNDGVLEYDNTNYMYAKMYEGNDTANQVPLAGWRVWDIDEANNTLVLVSAANPEDYRHNGGQAYQSEYILTGNVNSSWTDMTPETAAEGFTKRDWSMYVDSLQGAVSARALTRTDLNNWLAKYVSNNFGNIGNIYNSANVKYQSLIDNHSYYWLSAANYYGGLCYVDPGYRCVNDNRYYAFGVRVLVSIDLSSKISRKPTSTKAVTLKDMKWGSGTYTEASDYTYNVWTLL